MTVSERIPFSGFLVQCSKIVYRLCKEIVYSFMV